MRVHVAGRHVNVGESLRSRIVAELDANISKIFDRATDANVTIARANVGYVVDCQVNLPSGISLQAEGAGADAHKAFGAALEKIRNRTKRYKQRLRRRHGPGVAPVAAFAPLAAPVEADTFPEAETADASGPLVIAEPGKVVETLSVSQAVAALDRSDAPALMFRNASDSALNMVYRRADGHIGWVSPACRDVLNGHTKSA